MKRIHVAMILSSFYSLALCAADAAAQSQRDSAAYARAVEATIESRIAQSHKDGGSGYMQAHELAQAKQRASQSQSDKQRHYSSRSGGGRKNSF